MQEAHLIESYPTDDSESEYPSAKTLRKRVQYEQMETHEALTILLERQSKTHKLCKEIARRTDALEQQLIESQSRVEQLCEQQQQQWQKRGQQEETKLHASLHSAPADKGDPDSSSSTESSNCFFQPLIALIAACRRQTTRRGGARSRSDYAKMERGECTEEDVDAEIDCDAEEMLPAALTMVKED